MKGCFGSFSVLETFRCNRCTLSSIFYVLVFSHFATNVLLGENETCSIVSEGKPKVDYCSYKGTFWNQRINSNDTLFPTFAGWLPLVTQRYIDTFPIDENSLNTVKTVNNVLFSLVKPTPFSSKASLVTLSHNVLTELLDLNPVVETSHVFLKFISGYSSFLFPPALAHRYGGHQFGYWSGQLGDGRAALLGTLVNSNGDTSELNLKGSGLTPYSRQGDGRAVLRSSVREFLASEAMHYLGVPTSRALSLVVSDDTVIRDEFYNGRMRAERTAMVVRVAPSWFRIGSLEILARHGEIPLLRSLLDDVIEHHYGDVISVHDSDRYLMLFAEIVAGTAGLVAAWQSVGFTHGVCNTDNFSLLSLTIDYGPFGFLERYDLDFVPNTSDDEGRYSYGKQPAVGYFNLDKLRIALEPVLTDQQQKSARVVLDGYFGTFNQTLLQRSANKLGLPSASGAENKQLVDMFLKLLRKTRSDFTMSFRQLGEVSLDDMRTGSFDDRLWALKQLRSNRGFDAFLDKYAGRLKSAGVSEAARRRRMCAVNPAYVLRNWMAHAAIKRAEENDFSEVRRLQRVLQTPFTRQAEAERAGYSRRPPPWADDIKVSCSS